MRVFSLHTRGHKSSALEVHIKLPRRSNPIKYVVFMSAFAWLISLAPLSVGSGQCLVLDLDNVLFFFPDCFVVHVVFLVIFAKNGAEERFFDFLSRRQ